MTARRKRGSPPTWPFRDDDLLRLADFSRAVVVSTGGRLKAEILRAQHAGTAPPSITKKRRSAAGGTRVVTLWRWADVRRWLSQRGLLIEREVAAPEVVRRKRPRDYLTQREAAAFIGWSEQRLIDARKAVLAGDASAGPPFTRLGRRVRYREQELADWRRRAAAAPIGSISAADAAPKIRTAS